MEINEKVRTLREIKRFSQEEMAAKLGMSVNGYAKIERGKRRLDIPKLEQIAAVFGMDVADLITADTDTIYVARQNRLKDFQDLKQSVVCLINQDSPNHHTYYNGAEELLHEIKNLKQELAYQQELMSQKQRHFDELAAAQQREIDLLRDLLATLKNQLPAGETAA